MDGEQRGLAGLQVVASASDDAVERLAELVVAALVEYEAAPWLLRSVDAGAAKLLTVRQVAELLGVPCDSVYRHKEALGVIRLPSEGRRGALRFDRDTLRERLGERAVRADETVSAGGQPTSATGRVGFGVGAAAAAAEAGGVASWARKAAGQFDVVVLADGSRAFRLRFRVDGLRERETLHERRNCRCGCGGGWNEQTARAELDMLIAMAAVDPDAYAARRRRRRLAWRARSSRACRPSMSTRPGGCGRRSTASLGDRPIDTNTEADYRWRLSVHLLPFFGGYRLDEIDRKLCERFKATKLREAEELRAAIAAGADLRDARGRTARPLGPASIRKLLEMLAAILDEAIEDGHIDRNPARSRRHAGPGAQAAADLPRDGRARRADRRGGRAGRRRRPGDPRPASGGTAANGRRAVAARACGRTRSPPSSGSPRRRSTITWAGSAREGRAPTSAGAPSSRRSAARGVRVSELCDLRIREVRLHDPEGARFRIPDAKTEAGIREVQMSPDLADVFVAHFDRLRRAGQPTGADAYVFPNIRGGRISRQRVGAIVGEAARSRPSTMAERGLPPLPRTTPHTLRRTYISIALLANNFDVMWVMSQVGHADSKMTMDVYAQLEQRVKREHGRRSTSSSPGAQAAQRDRQEGRVSPIGPRIGPRAARRAVRSASGPLRAEERKNRPASRRFLGVARPGLEPGTPRFSVVCSTN